MSVALGLASVLLLGCGKATVREVRSVTGGGPGEAWLVVEEFEQKEGSSQTNDKRWQVYRCTVEDCKLVDTIKGIEAAPEE